MNTKREQYVRHAALWIVEKLNAGGLTLADCTIDAIEEALDAPVFQNLELSTQYLLDNLSRGQRRALAKAIAGAVSNHPDRIK